ncbi:MAG: hypothetical protein NZU63_07875 [Gemmataceae bacterium]|nr:hypothetical protein [Gemmataceae bacterium]MDW8242158.1 hypothetical protein [Thermogemmata sp.]
MAVMAEAPRGQLWNASRQCAWLVAVLIGGASVPACGLLHQSERHEQTTGSARPLDGSDPVADRPPGLSEFASYPRRPGEVVRRAENGPLAIPAPVSSGSSQPETPELPQPVGGATTTGTPTEPALLPCWTTGHATMPDPPLLAAVRAHIEGKPERALQAVAMLETDNQDFVLALLPILSSGAAIHWRKDPASAAELAGQLQALAERLEGFAALRLGTVAFCHPVHGYRRYEPWPANIPYRPGDLAQLYIEVSNINGQPAKGPRGETWLIQAQASVRICDAKGQTVAMPDPADPRQRVTVMRFEEKRYTRGPVRDYYLLCAFPVPEQPGVYTATVEVSDARGRRSAPSSPVEFRVATP